MFSWLLGRRVPYTGSIGARVEAFEPGHAIVSMRDRRGVRNHLHSVHAIALANVGELTTGLAVLGAMDEGVRGILTGLEVSYRRKARGRLTAETRCSVPAVVEPVDWRVEAHVRDASGAVVAVVTAAWRLARVPEAGP
jgi:acyl-coenzyme A thioesterase PaaI-like protein